MPRREDAPIGAPCWIELFTSDPARARDFYGEIFGWTSEEAGEEYGGYIAFAKDGRKVAGGMKNDGANGAPDFWTVYLASKDAEQTVTSSSEHGGQVFVPAMDVVDLGRMAVLADAGGSSVGVWEPKIHRGFEIWNEPGTPGWFELHTRAYDETLAYYGEVFGWETQSMSDSPEFRYTVLLDGEEQLAGVMDDSVFPDDAPGGWQIYFRVDDADATLAEVVNLGGSVVMPAEDTPFGRLAGATDPTGTFFKLIQGG